MKLSTILLPLWLILIVLGFWFWRTHELKNFVDSKVKEIEQNQGDKYTFKHGGIESRGFPFRSEVAVKYPSFTFNDEDGSREFFVDGDIILGSSLTGSEMWVRKAGPSHILAKEDSGNTDHWIITGDTTFSFAPTGTGLFTVIPESFKQGDYQQIAKDIARKGQIHGENVQVRNVLHGGEVNLADVVDTEDATSILDIKTADAGWKTVSKDKDLDQFLFSGDARYENALLKSLKTEDTAHLPDLGLFKFDFEGAITYDKNLDLGNTEQLLESFQTKPFSFEITKLNSSNNFDSSNSTLSLSTTPQKNGKIDVHFDGLNDAKLSKEGYDVTLFQIKQMLENAKENVPADQKDIYAKLPSLIGEIFPRYYELGKVHSRLNFDLDLGGGIIPFMLNNIDLKNFDWTSPLYGVRVNGSFRGPMEGFLGSANISLDNYRHLIESLASYYNSTLKSLSKSFGEAEISKFARQIPPNLVEKLVIFLKKISNEPSKDGKDIVITITHNSEGVKVGTLKAEEVAQEGFQLFKDIESAVKPNAPAEPAEPETKAAEPVVPVKEPALK